MLEMEVYHKRLDSNSVRLVFQVEIQGFENIYAYVPFLKKNKNTPLCEKKTPFCLCIRIEKEHSPC